LEENYEFDWENIAILDEEPQYRKSIRDATHQDTWPQLADKLGGAFQGLLSNCRRIINIEVLILSANQYIFFTLILNY